MPGIGATLREARMRAHLDIADVEESTRIRAKYLRALEDEDWEVLPAPAYVRSFLRLYASALGLDGDVLAEEYRRHHEPSSEVELAPLSAARRGVRDDRRRPPSRGVALGILGLVLVVLVVVLGLTQPSSNSPPRPPAASAPLGSVRTKRGATTSVVALARASLRLHATGTVRVCLENGFGRRLLNGVTLHAGQLSPLFVSRSMKVSFDSGNVVMRVDGLVMSVPRTPAPIGYLITPRTRHLLGARSLPVCR